MKLYTKSRALNAERWNGNNLDTIRKFCGGMRTRLRPEVPTRFGLEVLNGDEWFAIPLGWWVVEDGENFVRLNPDIAEEYCDTEPILATAEQYEAVKAAKARLSRVALGVEKLAIEVGTLKGNPALGQYLQDELRKLLCVHPTESLRTGDTETWCEICLSRVEEDDLAARESELMAHIVIWCKCDTSSCPVHTDANSELPIPNLVRKIL